VNIDDLGTYSDGYLHGATWGIAYGRRQVEQINDAIEDRDRRLTARLLEYAAPRLDPDMETFIDRHVRQWAEAEQRATTTGPVPTYAQCMASWGTP
jgi:hypothetical protein